MPTITTEPNPETETRSVIVTGASSGIGRALALLAAREGFAVTLVARRGYRLEEIATQIRAEGGTCATLAIDVCAPDAAQRIVDTAMQAFGRIDVVVNNAGTGATGLLLEVGDAALDAQWRLHVGAPLRIARAALPHLKAVRGQLMFVGSGIARVPVPNYGGYALAKGAIRVATTQLRRELRADGIAVTYVDPGLVATEFHEAIGIERDKEIPAAPPERVARAILRGIARRSVTVNGTPWQTLGATIGEWAATLADPVIISRAAKKLPVPEKPPVSTNEPDEAPPVPGLTRSLAGTLEPVSRRMERVKLQFDFLHSILVPGATLELNEVAMRWAGMPNKNERAALHEVLDVLAAAGYLEQTGEETWKVLRAAD